MPAAFNALATAFRKSEKSGSHIYGKDELAAEGSFRLLTIKSGGARDRLKARFVVTTLENPSQQYEALSYTWGPPQKAKLLWIQSDSSEAPACKMFITRNLQNALRALRHRTLSRTVWVDAVCINQEDNREKSSQVAMMRHIYARATRTIIYLGEEFPFCRQLIPHADTVVMLTPWARSVGDIMRHGPTRTTMSTFHAYLKRFRSFRTAASRSLLMAPKVNRRNWRLLHDWWCAWVKLFSHPWFSRCWVVQELIVSPCIQIQCGKAVLCTDKRMRFDESGGPRLKLKDFAGLILRLLRNGPAYQPPQGREYYVYATRLRSFVQAISLRAAYQQSRKASLPALLTRLGGYDASVDQDQLYAFLGLSREADEQSLRPDYSEKVRDTMCRYAKHFLAQEHGIRLLYDFRCGSESEDKLRDLPSWVPHWVSYLDIDNARIPWLTYLEDSVNAVPDPSDEQNRQSITSSSDFSDSDSSLSTGSSASADEELQNMQSLFHDALSFLGIGTVLLPLLNQSNQRFQQSTASHPSIYRASGNSASSMYVLDEAMTRLSVKGVIVDSIAQVGSVFVSPTWVAQTNPEEHARVIRDSYLEMDRIATAGHVHCPEGQTLAEVKWRTLKCDCSKYDHDKLEQLLNDYDRFKVALQEGISKDILTTQTRAAENMQERRMGPWQVYRNLSCDSKKLCLTGRGYLGQIPHSAEAREPSSDRTSDRVCIFLGSEVPHVIRPLDGGAFRLLGTAYIHGIMQGEAMEESGMEVEEIILV